MFRGDRDFQTTGLTKGGGVLLAVKNSFNSTRLNLDLLNNVIPAIDIVGCKISFGNIELCVFVLYIPPSVNACELETFLESFEALNCLLDNCKILICGDFNAPSYNTMVNDRKCILINNFISFLNVTQQNTVLNDNGRMLDLILANVECDIIRDYAPLTKEDNYHPAIIINLVINSNKPNNFAYNNTNVRYNFRRANFPLMYDMLFHTDWSFLQAFTDINDACTGFYATLNNIFDECVPKSKHIKQSYPPWFNTEIKNNIRKKHLAHKKYKKFKTINYLNEFRTLRSLIKTQINIGYKDYIQNIETTIQGDPSKFWSFVHTKKGTSRIPGNLQYNNMSYETPQDIVDGFSNYFSDVYIDSDPTHINENPLSINNNYINIRCITEEDLLKSIKKLKNKMTAGVDNVPSFVIKDCAAVFIEPLLTLFNLSLTTSKYPEVWKTARICPILKSGDPSHISNYRAISILCNFGKLLEIIIYDYIYSSVKGIISPAQHGFMEKRSTVTNLASITQYISQYLDSQGQVDVIYTDIQKAFDQIDHFLLLSKLKDIGFSDSLTSLVKSYLFDRQQFVEYGGFSSKLYIAKSGVPQGSNLGPLLFSIFFNGLTTIIDSPHLLFADDLKIYIKIDSIQGCVSLQNELNKICDWCSENFLKLNVSKCKVMSYSRKEDPVIFDYYINNNLLDRCVTYKDLGIIFDTKLTFTNHINEMVKSSCRVLGFLIRNWSGFVNINTMKLLYVSFIRSKLEYGSIIWYPLYQNSIILIESVQRKCLKYMFFKCNGYYPQRGIDNNILLNMFDLKPLRFRRECAVLTFLYNLIHNNVDCSLLLNKLKFLVPRLESRRNNTFYCDVIHSNVMIKSPIYNMCKTFNTISLLCDVHHDSLSKIIHIYQENSA